MIRITPEQEEAVDNLPESDMAIMQDAMRLVGIRQLYELTKRGDHQVVHQMSWSRGEQAEPDKQQRKRNDEDEIEPRRSV